MQVTVKRTINTRAWEGLNNKIEKKLSMQVGWFSSARYFNAGAESIRPWQLPKHVQTAYVAQVAAINEFGGHGIEGGRIPPRPFMRPAARHNAAKWAQLFAKDIRHLPLQYALDNLGFRVEGDIRKAITDVWNPPLKPITVEYRLRKQGAFIKRDSQGNIDQEKTNRAIQKKMSEVLGTHNSIVKPLIDTGYMIASVTHEVEHG